MLIDFYPRSPRGERPKLIVSPPVQWISIHAPREGSDRLGHCCVCACLISIHAPREGSDPSVPTGAGWDRNFYPRSPRGERLYDYGNNTAQFLFLSTLPARGATDTGHDIIHCSLISIHAPREGSDYTTHNKQRCRKISIHAPREGSDVGLPLASACLRYFYPRSPRGERRT